MSPEALSASVVTLHLDSDQPTVFMFSLTPSQNIAGSQFQSDFSTDTSYIDIAFPTSNSDCPTLFRSDLGLGITSGTYLPCYGITNINNNLKCQLLSQTIRVSNYTPLLSG